MDLFGFTSRDERQELARRRWIENKCRGTLVFPTGFGKTRIALNCIKSVINKRPHYRVLLIVPTDVLQKQWKAELDKNQLSLNCDVQVVNTVIRREWQCDILVLDEAHRYASDENYKLFKKVKYRYILGLTATIGRLDGKESLLLKHAPIVDSATIHEALLNGWVSKFNEYLVLIDVDDIQTYKDLQKTFTSHFEFFNFDFDLAMKMIGKDGHTYRARYVEMLLPHGTQAEKSNLFKVCTIHALGFINAIKERKKFINNHPDKIKIARKIIEARQGKKIITFSNNIKMAESIKAGGVVYSGKVSKKRGSNIMEDFNKKPSGVLHTVKKAIEGLDVPNLSVGINLGLDSSEIKAVQKLGRVIRAEAGKEAEMFNLVINNSVELEWFKKSHKNAKYITIGVEDLYKLLNNEEYETYQKPIPQLLFRF